jgi:hypothetical protein
MSTSGGIDNKVNTAPDHIRAAAQELHQAISDAAAKGGGAIQAELEAISRKATALTESIRISGAEQSEAAKPHLAKAATHLEATRKHAAEGLKSSGHAFEASIQQILVDMRGFAQEVSQAVAAARSANATPGPKK